MDNAEQIFQKACLIQLTTSIWSASKSIDAGLLQKIGRNSEWVKGRKFIINPELMGQIKTAAHQARNKVKKYALPFPLQAVHLVPKESISTIDEILQHYENRFWQSVQQFESLYASAREEARDMLGELFDESDYPSPGEIVKKFNFGWQFLALQVPGQTTILPPEIYEREKAKFQDMVEETRRLSLQALREEFHGILQILVERLQTNGSKPKMITNQMFNKITEFMETLQSKDLFDDQELKSLANQAEETIKNTSPSTLKYNADLRAAICEEMKVLKTSVEESIADIPRRQIRMEETIEEAA